MDIIFIRALRLEARVGLHRHEKAAPQTIELDIEIAVPGESVYASGKLGDTIDYGVAVDHIRALLAGEHFGLVENLADRIARMLLADFGTEWVKVGIAKLGVRKDAKHVGVCVERRRTP